jgi:uncharacterized RDD family membrane protein YckC
MNWYYVEQGQQAGPVNDNQLADLLRAGRINSDTLVWHEGMAEWLPFNRVRTELNPSAPPLIASTAPTEAPTPRPQANEAACAECGKIFPLDKMIRHGDAHICANCKPVFIQKLAEGAPVLAAGQLRYAGFWIRVVAKILDVLIIMIPIMVFGFITALSTVSGGRSHNPPTAYFFIQGFLQLSIIFVNLAYQTFFLGKYGATPGKMACKIKVVTSEGGKIGYGRAVGRFFAEMISGIICDIGYLLAAFDNPQKRALHDHICNTRVVYK